MIAISTRGFLSSFLLKGYIPAKLKSQYIDEKKIIMREDKPLLLIPYFNINYNHFMTEINPANPSTAYQVTAAAFAPAVSIIAQ